jgi:hypothetical protein
MFGLFFFMTFMNPCRAILINIALTVAPLETWLV